MKIVPGDGSPVDPKIQRKSSAARRDQPARRTAEAGHSVDTERSPGSQPRHLVRSHVVAAGFRAMRDLMRRGPVTPETVDSLVASTQFDGERVLAPHSATLRDLAARSDVDRLSRLIESTESNVGALVSGRDIDPYPLLRQVVSDIRRGTVPSVSVRPERVIDLLG